MRILITTPDDNTSSVAKNLVYSSDMVIVKRDKDFDIIKSRHGLTYNNLPIELLPNVIKHPKGKITMTWDNSDEITNEFDKFFTE